MAQDARTYWFLRYKVSVVRVHFSYFSYYWSLLHVKRRLHLIVLTSLVVNPHAAKHVDVAIIGFKFTFN